MPHAPHIATLAEYFRIGLTAGLLLPEEASNWAISEIARLEAPPYELIEVSYAKTPLDAIAALASVQGERDRQVAGAWALARLRESLRGPDFDVHLAAHLAMRIVRAAEFGDDIYYRFDMIEDEASLALTGAHGTLEDCRTHLLNELACYPLPPVSRSV
ncbi:MAG: hypothetical protein JSR41_25060 [Proteobacteria bacterium]|nr:hypothetical protein [Pseudomonadota bacterium]